MAPDNHSLAYKSACRKDRIPRKETRKGTPLATFVHIMMSHPGTDHQLRLQTVARVARTELKPLESSDVTWRARLVVPTLRVCDMHSLATGLIASRTPSGRTCTYPSPECSCRHGAHRPCIAALNRWHPCITRSRTGGHATRTTSTAAVAPSDQR